jgi:hypothetical protein
MDSEPHRNPGFLNSPRTYSEITELKNRNTDKDQRDSGVGLDNTTQNIVIDGAKKTVFFREPLHSEV